MQVLPAPSTLGTLPIAVWWREPYAYTLAHLPLQHHSYQYWLHTCINKLDTLTPAYLLLQYHSYQDMTDFLAALAALYPDVCAVRSLGTRWVMKPTQCQQACLVLVDFMFIG